MSGTKLYASTFSWGNPYHMLRVQLWAEHQGSRHDFYCSNTVSVQPLFNVEVLELDPRHTGHTTQLNNSHISALKASMLGFICPVHHFKCYMNIPSALFP